MRFGFLQTAQQLEKDRWGKIIENAVGFSRNGHLMARREMPEESSRLKSESR